MIKDVKNFKNNLLQNILQQIQLEGTLVLPALKTIIKPGSSFKKPD